SDLAAQAASSPLLRAAVNGHPPAGTLFGNAFVKGAGSAVADALAPASWPLLPSANAGKPNPPPPPVSSPDYGLSMFLWGQSATTDRDLKIASGANFHWQKTL